MKHIILIAVSVLPVICGNQTIKTVEPVDESLKMESKRNTAYTLPKGAITKIHMEYSDKDHQELIINSLIQLGIDRDLTGARIPRCVLFLSKGELDSFKRYLKSAETDWRDIIYWAEYEGDFENHNVKQVRDFNKTFEENGL